MEGIDKINIDQSYGTVLPKFHLYVWKLAEAYQSVGHKEHMPPPPLSMLLIKNLPFEASGADAKNKSLFSYIKIFCPPLVCYASGAFLEEADILMCHSSAILSLLKIFMTPPLNMKSALDKKKSGTCHWKQGISVAFYQLIRIQESTNHK